MPVAPACNPYCELTHQTIFLKSAPFPNNLSSHSNGTTEPFALLESTRVTHGDYNEKYFYNTYLDDLFDCSANSVGISSRKEHLCSKFSASPTTVFRCSVSGYNGEAS